MRKTVKSFVLVLALTAVALLSGGVFSPKAAMADGGPLPLCPPQSCGTRCWCPLNAPAPAPSKGLGGWMSSNSVTR